MIEAKVYDNVNRRDTLVPTSSYELQPFRNFWLVNDDQVSHEAVPVSTFQSKRNLYDVLRKIRKYRAAKLMGSATAAKYTELPAEEREVDDEDEFTKKLMLSRGLLKDAISEAFEDGCAEPTPQAMMGAHDMLGIVGKVPQDHEVKTFVTDDRDVVTDITDCEKNYVMLINRADGSAAVHFNIRSYQEYEKQGDVSEEFLGTLLKSLKLRAPVP